MGPLRIQHFSTRNNKILPHQDASRDILRNALLSVQAMRQVACEYARAVRKDSMLAHDSRDDFLPIITPL
jgi:hypothetical protein